MKNTIKELRKEKSITQSELAKVIGISRKALSSIESGSSDPSLSHAYNIASYFQTPVEEVFINKVQETSAVYTTKRTIRFIDLFAGIGGFRFAAESVLDTLNYSAECVFSSEIDKYAQQSYEANFGKFPDGDISKIHSSDIPDHDILFAGFPCQPFSIIGLGKGFDDIRGTLFFEIARIIRDKQPSSFVLENVKRLVGHDNGNTMKVILKTLRDLGYFVEYKILNALDYGLPQKRERVVIVGSKKPFTFNQYKNSFTTIKLSEILEKKVSKKYYASPEIVKKRKEKHIPKSSPAIWHENKSGNISSYPYSCALRAGASYNYLLVDGLRRLTPREQLQLQGFPKDFKITVSDAQIRKQTGNAVPVRMIEGVLLEVLPQIFDN